MASWAVRPVFFWRNRSSKFSWHPPLFPHNLNLISKCTGKDCFNYKTNILPSNRPEKKAERNASSKASSKILRNADWRYGEYNRGNRQRPPGFWRFIHFRPPYFSQFEFDGILKIILKSVPWNIVSVLVIIGLILLQPHYNEKQTGPASVRSRFCSFRWNYIGRRLHYLFD